MKSGKGHSKPVRRAMLPYAAQEEITLYRAGKLGLAVRMPGLRHPKSTVHQLFWRVDNETMRAGH